MTYDLLQTETSVFTPTLRGGRSAFLERGDVGTYRTRQLRRAHLVHHLADALLGVAIGAPLAVVLWLGTLWWLAR